MKNKGWLAGLAILLFFAGLVFLYFFFVEVSTPIVQLTPTKIAPIIRSTKTPEPTKTQTKKVSLTEEFVPKPTEILPTPTSLPVNGYILSDTVDMSAGLPTALEIIFPDGSKMVSNWALAISYHDKDVPSDVFGPGAGTIYSYQGDVMGVWMHSGTYRWKDMFAKRFDEYFRFDHWTEISWKQALVKASGLSGLSAGLCQASNGSVQSFAPYDGDCKYTYLPLKIVGAVLVPHEMMTAYEANTLSTLQWVQGVFPGSGFENLKPGAGFVVKFCVGRLGDQVSDGSPDYLYNRAVIGFELVR